MPNLLLTMWDTIKSSNIGILVAAGLGMFAIIGGLSMLSYHYTLSGIKSRTVGDGQHGTARWATDKEIRKTYAHVPFKVRDWRKGVSLPTEQGLVLGCKGKKDELTALVDSDDIHCLMIAASGAGKTAFFLYPNLEYACASGMSFLALDTKGDLARNYGSIAKKYYGYKHKKNVFHGSFYSEEEMLTLFDAVSGDPLELCVKIAAYYGLRRSEVLGLRWSAIDMEHKTISISHKVIEAEVDGKFVPMGEDVLKTKSSFRTLPLIPAVGIILLEEKEKQEMYRRLFKKSYCRDYLDYICVDQCGKLLRPNYVTEHFSWLIEKYGLRKVRFHDLRHTCASLLLSNGISMKQIQIWLGHSTFSTTADIYAHLDYSAQEASANAMNGMFNRPGKEEQLA